MKYFLINLIFLINFIIIIIIGWFILDMFSAYNDHNEGNEKSINLILIVVDTLRADYLACYGNNFVKTPNIDKLASDGVLFEDVIAQSSWTLPSHATLMTSKYPIQHGVLSYNNPLSESEVTLAETLKTNKYTTCAFISTALVSSKFGFNQGFDTFDEELDPDYQRPVTKFHSKSLKWIEQNYRKKFFLWMHYFEPHHPYLYHEPYTNLYEFYLNKGKTGKFNYTHEWVSEEFNRGKVDLSTKDLNRLKALYGGEVSYIDEFIGELIEKIKKLGIYDRSVIVLTSDHGESLGEHHLIEHGESLYEPEIRVPLIIKFPFDNGGIEKGKRVKFRAQLIDIMPTILSALKIKPQTKLYGYNLIPYIKTETGFTNFNCFSETNNFKSIIQKDWKFILSLPIRNKPELFNLTHDSGETKNLFDSNLDIGLKLKENLLKWIVDMNNPSPKKVKLDEKTETKLKSLGYMNAGVDRTIKMNGFPPPEEIFRADFEKRLNANLSGGDPKAKLIGSPKIGQSQGRDRRGVLIDKNHYVEFDVKGNLIEEEGSMEFWIKPLWKWRDAKKHLLFTVIDSTGKNIMELIIEEKVYDKEGKIYYGPFLSFRILTDKWYKTLCNVSNISDDIPHHIFLSWKANEEGLNNGIKLYVDGVKDEFSEDPGKIPKQVNAGRLLRIGDFGSGKESGAIVSGLKIYETYHDYGSLIIELVKKII